MASSLTATTLQVNGTQSITGISTTVNNSNTEIPASAAVYSFVGSRIVEEGDNYMRFSNGVQIYYARLPIVVSGWTSWDTLQMTTTGINHIYAAPFAYPPAFVAFAEAIKDTATLSVMQFENNHPSDNLPSATQTGQLRILRPNGGGTGTFYINIIAIGKWE